MRDINLEDLDDPRTTCHESLNGKEKSSKKIRSSDGTHIEKKKKKKDKNKDEEKSKRKKEKRQDKDTNGKSKGQEQRTQNIDDINLWLENTQPTAQSIALNDQDNQEDCTSAKKHKKKHKKHKEEKHGTDQPIKQLLLKAPKMQHLIDHDNIKVDCSIEPIINIAGDENAKLSFLCENTSDECMDDVEVNVESMAEHVVVIPNIIKTKIMQRSAETVTVLLKVTKIVR